MRHELHLTVRGLRALAGAAVALACFGAVLGGRTGALSVAVGAGLVAANAVAAALSTGWARTLGLGVIAVGYALFVVRMFAMFAGLAVLAQADWIHQPLLASAFFVSLVVLLGAECWSYARKTYVPEWRVVRR